MDHHAVLGQGRGNRSAGRIAACAIGRIAWAKDRLRDRCQAVRIEITSEVHRPAVEVPRTGEEDDFTWILGTLPRIPAGSLFGDHTEADDTSWRVDHPPDG